MTPDQAVAFKLDLPAGRCVGVRLPTADQLDLFAREHLLSDELTFLAGLPVARRPSWTAGRVALREALTDLGLPTTPLLPTSRGGPTLPPGAAGSLSHKGDLAVAVAAPRGPRGVDLGIDLENLARPPRQEIGRRVLTPTERAAIAALPAESRARETLLRFSLKESLYKAVDPRVRRFVSFQEVEVHPQRDGSAAFVFHLTGGEGPFDVEAWWLERPPHLITIVRLSDV